MSLIPEDLIFYKELNKKSSFFLSFFFNKKSSKIDFKSKAYFPTLHKRIVMD